MERIAFRLDHFIELLQNAKSALINTELKFIKGTKKLVKFQITNTFQIFDGRKFSISVTKAIEPLKIESDSLMYSYSQIFPSIAAENVFVYYSFDIQAAYFRNNSGSRKMAEILEMCLTQDILDLLTTHPNEREIIDLHFQEMYAKDTHDHTILHPNKIYRPLTSKFRATAKKPGSLNYILKFADRIKTPSNNYAYQLLKFNQQKEKHAPTLVADQKQTVTDTEITAQELDSPLSDDIDFNAPPNALDDAETSDQSLEDAPLKISLSNDPFILLDFENSGVPDTENFNNGLDHSEPEVKEIPSVKIKSSDFDVFELESSTPPTPNDLPKLDIPTLELRNPTPVSTPTPVPEFDLGFIDCQAPHKFEFKLPFPHKLTGWLDRIRENLKVPRLFYIPLTDTQDISFKGRLMAAANSGDAKLSLYQTLGGKWIGIQQKNLVPGQEITVACICQDKNEICNFFGFSESAKEIYYQSGIDSSSYIH